jgi:GT2 family glycosyltransferase
MRKTSIIIPTYNGQELLRDCLYSIRESTKGIPYELIVVDNGSTDGTLDLCMRERVTFVSLPRNMGFPEACNVGLRVASGEALLLLNNDVLATPHWLEHMLLCLDSSSDVGIVGPVSNYASGKQQLKEPYTDLEDMSKRFSHSDPSKWLEVRRIVGLCFLFKREVMEKVGLLDEQFSPGHFEDDDYCMRARQAGYRLMIAGDTFLFHHGSQSFSREGNEAHQALIARNKQKFIEKWGEDPEKFIDER